jgi:hypothetical protein
MTAEARGWLRENAALVLLGAALVAAAAQLLALAADLTYFQDTWSFLMHRRELTADAFLQPHNEHIVVIPVALEQLLLRLFGMGSATPEYLLLTASLLATATLVFVYVRRRLGPWPALMAAALLLFLGPAWQDLLWPFQVGLVSSVLFGVAMLLALERDDRSGDVAACAFLALSIGFSSLGVAFAVGAAVDVLQWRRERGLRRAWLVAVPFLLYAAWYVGWGHTAESHLSLHNVLVSPAFVYDGLTASVDSLLALSTIADEVVGRSKWAEVVLVGLLALLLYALWRRRSLPPPRLWPVLAAAATFWLLAAFNHFPGREAYSSRYLYVGAAFLLLIVADLLSGVRLGRRALLVAGTATVAIAAFNLVPLREGRDFLREQAVLTRADLAGLEIAAGSVPPSFALSEGVAGTRFLGDVQAGEYLAAVGEHGSPAYTPSELAGAPEPGRQQADVVLANALPVTTEFEAATPAGAVACVKVPGDDGRDAPPLRLRPGLTAIELGPGGPGTIRLRRFAADGYPLVSEGVPGDSTTLLRIPSDGVARPWRLRVDAPGPATVCRGPVTLAAGSSRPPAGE